MKPTKPETASPEEDGIAKASRLPSERNDAPRSVPNVHISTQHILKNFSQSRPDSDYSEWLKTKREWEVRQRFAREVVVRTAHPSLRTAVSGMARKALDSPSQLKSWHDRLDREARETCSFYYPQRASIPVHVVDFKAESATRYTTSVGEIERFMDSKPEDVTVRWMHVPTDRGILHSTLEDLFNYSGSGKIGKPFPNAGSGSFPYLHRAQMLSFCSHDRFSDRIEAWNVLSKLDVLANGPSDDVLAQMTGRMRHDVLWRSNHVGADVDFWVMAKCDNQDLLSDRQIGRDLRKSVKIPKVGLPLPVKQALAHHEQFRNAIMVVSRLRIFHRSDGYMLTFAPDAGVDYLDTNFTEYLRQPSDRLLNNSDASVLAFVGKTFLDSGTKRWHRKTVEWLAVYLVTEAAVTPHAIRQGFNAGTFPAAYQEIAIELKQQQKNPWRRGESVTMVRRYLNCLDELRVIQSLMKGKIDFLENLLVDCERIAKEWEDEGLEECLDEEAESMTNRVQWALKILGESIQDIDILVDHFHTSMGELFQLRSIEQNELAITADSQNKAILVFTGVTMVFLPLSFFTSYFGMNLQGLHENEHDELYFWRVCGSSAFVLVAAIVSIAFRLQIWHGMWLIYARAAGVPVTVPRPVLG